MKNKMSLSHCHKEQASRYHKEHSAYVSFKQFDYKDTES